MREHHPHVLALASPEADLDLETRSLAPLRAAFDRLQQQGGVDPTLTFSSLLSDSPRSQHDLSEGVHEKLRAALLSRCSTDAEAADRRSCGGQYAGLWLSTSLRSYYTQARGSLFSIALRVRLLVPLRELMPRGGVTRVLCGGCGETVDALGRHYAVCKSKNRENVQVIRHDGYEQALIRHLRLAGKKATPANRNNMFGLPYRPSGKYPAVDITCSNYFATGRALQIDCAVVTPSAGTYLKRGSATKTGVAAEVRAAAKRAKYEGLVERKGDKFRPAVIERFGAFGEDLQWLVAQMAGDGDRDPFRCKDDDYCFSTRSRKTYIAGDLALAAVIGDALLIATLAEKDVAGVPASSMAARSLDAASRASYGWHDARNRRDSAFGPSDRCPTWHERAAQRMYIQPCSG